MDVTEVLKATDNLVFADTGKHLDDLQEAILRGVLQDKKYSAIAEERNCTEGHVRDVASELWKLLSNILSENINKFNLRSTLKRWTFNKVASGSEKAFVQINNINSSTDNIHPSNIQITETLNIDTLNKPQASGASRVNKYLDDAPDISTFYGRTQELTTLKKWIVEDNCRLLAILGVVGIGKTALAVKLIEQIQDKFDFIFWRSLRSKPQLESIEKDFIQFLETNSQVDSSSSKLIQYLRKYRCLLILDDVQAILSGGQLAGNYEPGYEDYGLLFRELGELNHQSCVLLLSWEKPKEIAALEIDKKYVRSIKINGLDTENSSDILKEQGLTESEQWEILINQYAGNPSWLKMVATTIKDFFGGRVSELFKYDTIFLSEDLKQTLHQQYNRLTDLEKQVISALAVETNPVSISKLIQSINLPPLDVFNAVQSLERRSLIEKQQQSSEAVFTLQPVVREYIKFTGFTPPVG
ncbi:MAG: NB-ARC domain-containing protein [Crinalium sp.]